MARSRALCAEFSDATLRGVGGKEGMGEGLAAETPLASGGCGPRTPGPDDPAGPVSVCPARQAAPIRPRAISVGRRAGIRAAPPPRALGKLRAPSGSDRRTLAPEHKPRTRPP